MKPLLQTSIKIRLKAVPGASSDGWEWVGDDKSLLKIRVKAPPEKGKANKVVEKYLAGLLPTPAFEVILPIPQTGSDLK